MSLRGWCSVDRSRRGLRRFQLPNFKTECSTEDTEGCRGPGSAVPVGVAHQGRLAVSHAGPLLGEGGEAGVWQIALGQWGPLSSGGLLGPKQWAWASPSPAAHGPSQMPGSPLRVPRR